MDIYSFGLGEKVTETTPEMLGGKGAGLVWMNSIGVKVPPGFILPTEACAAFMQHPKEVMKQVAKDIKPYVKKLADKFGYMPLVSVRSGARVSLPGMMDTILNVGIDNDTREEWIERLGGECVYKSELRLIEMYGNVVKGKDRKVFEVANVGDAHLAYEKATGEKFPNAEGQILGAIEAVFKSWNNDRAKFYRKMNNIPESWGTAVVVQAMVFGNMNDKSCTGVLFTRDTNTGENAIVGEFLPNAQGEDVVDGSHTPMSLSEMPQWNSKLADELAITVDKLEKTRKEVQDVEFTVQDGELFILQTRNANKIPPAAKINIVLDMVEEGLITAEEAFKRATVVDYDKAQSVVIDPKFTKEPKATGIAACQGVVTGKAVFTAKDAINCKESCILVTEETDPNDIAGMHAAKGVLTMKGGTTCHAAVVCRGMNKPCVVGLGMDKKEFYGKIVSIDGETGRVWIGEVPVVDGSHNPVAGRYRNFLRKHFEYVPMVSEQIPNPPAEVLYVVGLSSNDLAKYTADIDYYLKHCERLYIDLRPSRADDAESVFFGLFNTGVNVTDVVTAYLLQLGELSKKVTVIGTHKEGLASVPELNTIEDLIMADDLVAPGSLKMTTAPVKRVLSWKGKQSFKFLSVDHYEPNKKVAKSFISDVKALHMAS